MSKKIHYERDSYRFAQGDYLPGYTVHVNSEESYQKLEAYIDQLVDFAAEIREHEPTWKRE